MHEVSVPPKKELRACKSEMRKDRISQHQQLYNQNQDDGIQPAR